MTEQEHRMLAFAILAEESRRKSQQSGYIRFVILAGVAACRAGLSRVAARCYELVLASNPQHLLSYFESLEEALRSDEFKPFLLHLDRFCTFERAEHLLEQLEIDWKSGEESLELEAQVLGLLGEID